MIAIAIDIGHYGNVFIYYEIYSEMMIIPILWFCCRIVAVLGGRAYCDQPD